GNVREALAGLGYASEEIRDAMRDLPDSGSAEDLLRDALRLLGVRRA
ncbi:MAG: holliday junction helicase RuvA, partial [Ilumatobacteraceae bacterium]